MIKKTICLTIISCAVIIFAIACGKNGKECYVSIGMVADQTGALALYGDWAVKGATIAKDRINNSGGIKGCKLQLLIQDGQSSPQAAVSAVRHLINVEKVPAIIIATGTGSLMAAAPVCNQEGVVLFGTLASGPIVTAAGDYIFRNRISGNLEVIAIAHFAIKKSINRIALALLNNEAGRSYEQAFRSVFNDLGGEIVAVEWLDYGGSDYRTQVLKIKTHDEVEGVFFGANVKEIGMFIKQSKELGFKTKWMAMTSVETDELFKIVGDEADGLIYAAEAYDYENPITREFDSEYYSCFHEHSQNYSANNYDAVTIIAEAIMNGAKYGDQIKDYLYDIHDYEGVSGLMSFDKNGDVVKSISIKEVLNRSFRIYRSESDN